MKTSKLIIHHKSNCTTLDVRTGLGLQAICKQHQTPVEFDCREADCGVCIFRVRENIGHLSPKTKAESDFLKAMHASDSERLACQVRVFGDVSIEVETF
jgi:ferredoxin